MDAPLIALSEGRKARPRKSPAVRPFEIELHMTVASLLREHIKTGWQWTHIAHGGGHDIRTAAKLKAMGKQRGWPDFILVPPTGLIHCLELKRLGKKLTRDQESFRIWCFVNQVPHAVAWTLDDALSVLVRWECLRISVSGARS